MDFGMCDEKVLSCCHKCDIINDDELLEAYVHGIIVMCGDAIM